MPVNEPASPQAAPVLAFGLVLPNFNILRKFDTAKRLSHSGYSRRLIRRNTDAVLRISSKRVRQAKSGKQVLYFP
ncbi:protein of unknown function [Pararobbsia alpina]